MLQRAELPRQVWAEIADDLRTLHDQFHTWRGVAEGRPPREAVLDRILVAAGLVVCERFRRLVDRSGCHPTAETCVDAAVAAIRAARDAEAERPARTPAEELAHSLGADDDIDEALARLSLGPTPYSHFVYRRALVGRATVEEALEAFGLEEEYERATGGRAKLGVPPHAPVPWYDEFRGRLAEVETWATKSAVFAASKAAHGLKFARTERDAKRAGPDSELWFPCVDGLMAERAPFTRKARPYDYGYVEPLVEGPMNCGRTQNWPPRVRFEYECPKQWAELEATDDAAVRFCFECRHRVYYCASESEVREHAALGHCIGVAQQTCRDFPPWKSGFLVGWPTASSCIAATLFPTEARSRRRQRRPE